MAATTVVVMSEDSGQPDIFFGEREQGVTLGAAHPTARVLPQEKNHKRENQGERNRDGQWNDRHGERR
jgi:hypothetical protein